MIKPAIKAALTANTALMAVLIGGVYTFEETKREGIGRKSTPDAYAEDGFLRPSAVIRGRDPQPFGGLNDPDTQAQSLQQMVELYLYDDGGRGYAALNTAAALIYRILHQRLIEGAGHLKRTSGGEPMPDPVLNNASVLRLVYSVLYVETSG